MSTLVTAGKSAKVIIKSALEERLMKLPKGELPSEQIASSLKGPVQNLEIEQSGVAEKLRVSKTYDPERLLEDLKNRRDKYEVREFRGTPVKNEAISDYYPPQNLHEEWRNLRNSIGDVNDPEDAVGQTTNIESINEFIKYHEQQIQFTNMHVPEPNQWDIAEIANSRESIEKATKLKEAIIADMREQYNISTLSRDDFDDFTGLLDEAGMDIGTTEFTKENIDSIIYRFEEAQMNAEMSFQREGYEELLDRAHTLKAKLQKPIPSDGRAAFPEQADRWDTLLESNKYDEADFTSENIDTFIETQKHEIDALMESDYPAAQEYTILQLEDEIAEATAMKADLDALVTGQTRYEFSHNMDTAILPDTDRASYAVRVYENPTVNTKGLNYTEIGHIPEGQNGVFHTRTDSPKSWVLRIMEIQSDIQNSLTKKRNGAVARWRRDFTPEMYNRDILGSNSTWDDVGEVQAVRGRVNKELEKTISEELGTKIEFSSTSVISDIRKTLVDRLRVNETSYSPEAYNFIEVLNFPDSRLARENINRQFLEGSTEVVEEISAKTGLTNPQVRDIIDQAKDIEYNYQRAIRRVQEADSDAHRKSQRLRVSPEERRARIVTGNGVTKEEGELNSNAVVETLQEISDKHGTVFEPYKGAKNADDFYSIIIDTLLPDHKQVTAGQVRQIAPNGNYSDQEAVRVAETINNSIKRGESSGIDVLQQLYPDAPIREAIDDATKIFDKKIKEGMEKLEPLEQFPYNKDYKLDVPWMKQGIQEEVVRAINNGQKEVWLTINPEGIGALNRGPGVARNYSKGGDMYNTFKAVARRFDADVIEEDGYLKMLIPDAPKPSGNKKLAVGVAASAFTVNLYAGTNEDDWINAQIKNGAPTEQIAAYLAKKSIPETEESLWEEKMIKDGAPQEQIDAFKQKKFANKINGMDPSTFAKHEGPRSDDRTGQTVALLSQLPKSEMSQRGPTYKELSPETIKELAIELEVDPSTPSGIDEIYQEAFWKENPEKYAEYQEKVNEELLSLSDIRGETADYINLKDNWKIFSFMASGFGNAYAAAWRNQEEKKLHDFVVEKGNEAGLTLEFGKGQKIGEQTLEADEWYVKLPDPGTGELLYWKATPGVLQQMAGEKYQDVGMLMGGIYGAQQANKMTRWVNGIPIPALRYVRWGTIGGWTIAGAVTGSLIDQAEVNIKQHEDFNWKTTFDRAVGAAELAIVGEVAGHLLGYVGGWPVKYLLKAYNHLIDGNVTGAFDILSKMTGLTKAEMKEIVAKWEIQNGKSAPILTRSWYSPRRYVKTEAKKEMEQAIGIIPVTRYGGDEIVRGISTKNPGAGAVIGNDIHQRAIMMGKVTEDLLNVHGKKQTVNDLLEAIPRWVEETETNLIQVKQAGNDLTPAGYSVNNKANVLPQFANKVKTVKYEPGYGFNMKEDYINQLYDGSIPAVDGMPVAHKLERLNLESTDRSFGGLLDFRDKVQQLFDDPRNPKYTRDKLNNMLTSIDQEIEAVSKRMGPGGAEWLDNYWAALMDAKEMRELQKTGLYRTLTRKEGSEYYASGLDEDKVADTLVKFGRSLDGSYQSFVRQLPLEIQPKVEALVMNRLVEKYTYNKGQGFEAIMFPQLAEELRRFEFIWPEAKAIREIAEQFGEVYKNDVRLSVAARGAITEDAFTSYLTTNPITRAQFAIASTIFNKASTLAGTSRGDASALVRIATKLLKEPLDPTNVQLALDAAKGDAALTGAIKRLSAQAAADKHAGKVDVKIKVYRNNGKLTAKASEGAKEVESIPAHRVAANNIASAIVKDGTNLANLSKTDRARLINKGYIAIGLEDGTIIKLN